MLNEYYAKASQQNTFRWCIDSFLYTMDFGIVSSDKILFLWLNPSNQSCIQRFFSKMKLVKMLSCTQLKQSNLEHGFHILTESPGGFNDTVCGWIKIL